MQSLSFTASEQEERIKKNNTVDIASSFGFLNAHNGLRRGKTHVVLGTAGGGKSTLVRSLIRDFLFKKENEDLGLCIQLSEETCDEYKTQLVYGLPAHKTLERGVLVSEEEKPEEDFDYFLDLHRMLSPDLLVYDNLTTSRFYEGVTVKDQARIFAKIKSLTKEINCATVVIAHTSSEVNDGMDRLINLNDIRGSKSIPNMAEFLYILQRFKVKEQYIPTICTVKHRDQELINSLYFLQYEKSTRSFIKDSPLDFDRFKELHGQRQKLGR